MIIIKIKQDPVRYMLDILGKKWTFEILSVLLEEEMQFSEIKRMYPEMSGKMLSRRVKELFELGLIGKAISNIQPLEFKYYLSDKGKLLSSVFYELAVVGTRIFREEILENTSCDTVMIEKYFEDIYII